MSDRIAHEPLDRPLAIIAAEVGLTAGTAYLGGVCLAIAAHNGDAPAVAVIFAVAAIALAFTYTLWLLGGAGTALACVCLPLLILSFDALLVGTGFLDLGAGLGPLGPGLGGVWPPLLAVVAAGGGLLAGLLLPGPRRLRNKPARRAAVTASAHLSEGAVHERLRSANVAPPSAPLRDDIWFDDSTDEDGLLPSHHDSLPEQPSEQPEQTSA